MSKYFLLLYAKSDQPGPGQVRRTLHPLTFSLAKCLSFTCLPILVLVRCEGHFTLLFIVWPNVYPSLVCQVGQAKTTGAKDTPPSCLQSGLNVYPSLVCQVGQAKTTGAKDTPPSCLQSENVTRMPRYFQAY